MTILVTGGTGYIGSHTVVKLIEQGYEVVIIDNLINSSRSVIDRIHSITGVRPTLYIDDVRTSESLGTIFTSHSFEAAIHFAGLKSVKDSVTDPLSYYQNNVHGSFALLEAMKQKGVNKLIFSSSATVYGNAPTPYHESNVTGQGIANPYGRTKYMVEQTLEDVANSNPQAEFTSLRYFNPIGAHPSGLLGEHPSGAPTNLMPYITQVAIGERDSLSIFGGDYETSDGTGVRDYIHVDDIAEGHIAALQHSTPGFKAINLGSGKGTSVLELLHSFEEASGITIPYKLLPRRPGDLAESYADPRMAKELLDWQSQRTITQACKDSWNWQINNPKGYI